MGKVFLLITFGITHGKYATEFDCCNTVSHNVLLCDMFKSDLPSEELPVNAEKGFHLVFIMKNCSISVFFFSRGSKKDQHKKALVVVN